MNNSKIPRTFSLLLKSSANRMRRCWWRWAGEGSDRGHSCAPGHPTASLNSFFVPLYLDFPTVLSRKLSTVTSQEDKYGPILFIHTTSLSSPQLMVYFPFIKFKNLPKNFRFLLWIYPPATDNLRDFFPSPDKPP